MRGSRILAAASMTVAAVVLPASVAVADPIVSVSNNGRVAPGGVVTLTVGGCLTTPALQTTTLERLLVADEDVPRNPTTISLVVPETAAPGTYAVRFTCTETDNSSGEFTANVVVTNDGGRDGEGRDGEGRDGEGRGGDHGGGGGYGGGHGNKGGHGGYGRGHGYGGDDRCESWWGDKGDDDDHGGGGGGYGGGDNGGGGRGGDNGGGNGGGGRGGDNGGGNDREGNGNGGGNNENGNGNNGNGNNNDNDNNGDLTAQSFGSSSDDGRNMDDSWGSGGGRGGDNGGGYGRGNKGCKGGHGGGGGGGYGGGGGGNGGGGGGGGGNGGGPDTGFGGSIGMNAPETLLGASLLVAGAGAGVYMLRRRRANGGKA